MTSKMDCADLESKVKVEDKGTFYDVTLDLTGLGSHDTPADVYRAAHLPELLREKAVHVTISQYDEKLSAIIGSLYPLWRDYPNLTVEFPERLRGYVDQKLTHTGFSNIIVYDPENGYRSKRCA